jgi:hypothetical protein
VPQPWPTNPGDRPPLSRESTAAWTPKGTSVLDRPATGGDGAGPGSHRPPTGSVPPVWIAAVVVLAVLLVLAVVALVWPDGGDDVATSPTSLGRTTTTAPARPGPSTPPTSNAPSVAPPSTVPPVGPPPSQAEVQAAVDALVPFVERTRGVPFTTRPAVEVADNAAFDTQVRAAFDRHEDVWEQRALLMQVLGIVDPRLDVVGLFRANEPIGRMAFYDPLRRTIVVRGQKITPYTREQLVATLTRALDDQHLGTDRPAYDQSPDEITWTFDALKAGDATRVSDAWVQTLTPADQATRERAEQDAFVGADLTRLPPAVRELDAFPLEAGTVFAGALAAGGNGPLDAAFATPPTASTYVLHPERFTAQVPIVPVPAPAVEGRVLHTAMFGELMTVATLSDTLAPDAASRAAAGWAGDSYVLYEGQSGTPCIRIAYKATSPAGFTELRQAYTTWAQGHEGAEVAVDGDMLVVNRCITGGRGRSPA